MLVDAVMLVAATAVGLTLLRPALGSAAMVIPSFRGRWLAVESSIFHGLLYGTPILLTWSVTTLALSFRHPRPPIRRLVRRPGFVANASAIAGAALVSMHYMVQTAIDPGRTGRYMHVMSTGLPAEIGYFVIGSWVALALYRRCRPYPVWTDQLSWALSALWVGMAILTWSRLYLMLLS
jgi:hypothetical protein